VLQKAVPETSLYLPVAQPTQTLLAFCAEQALLISWPAGQDKVHGVQLPPTPLVLNVLASQLVHSELLAAVHALETYWPEKQTEHVAHELVPPILLYEVPEVHPVQRLSFRRVLQRSVKPKPILHDVTAHSTQALPSALFCEGK
jgi:hypothetical protein